MKEQGKNLQAQINEEEIGNLPEKELRVMILKMMQSLGNRMEARTEKIQEMFNKDLEELKNKQREMNNTITEMINTLKGINNRITEAEERISELEDKRVDITAEEQNKEKRMKRIEDNLRDLWDNTKGTSIRIKGSQKKKRKRKDLRKYLKRLQSKTSLTWERKQSPKSRKHRESHTIQDKPQEKHTKTHINQTNKLISKKKY